jgi:hypothetical protein
MTERHSIRSELHPDPKEPRRIRDPELMRELVSAGQSGHFPCIVCRENFTEPHHVYLRSRGGDDVEANIVYLCSRCHRAYHGTPYTAKHYSGFPISGASLRIDDGWVRFKLARWLESDRGQYCRAYLVGKLGRGVAEAYAKREFGVEL